MWGQIVSSYSCLQVAERGGEGRGGEGGREGEGREGGRGEGGREGGREGNRIN